MPFAWPTAHAPQPLAPDSVQVWAWLLDPSSGDLANVELAAHTALLDEEESGRFHRFHFDRDRSHFAISHANMRRILGAHLGQTPESLRFISNHYGKPELAGRTAGDGLSKPLRFNLSHSRSVGLLALASGIEVGVDVEDVRPIEPGVARSTFSAAELADLSRLDGDAWLRGFYHCWTRKEAIVKAEGVGLSLPLAAFDVSLVPGAPAQLLGMRSPLALRHPWKLHDLPLFPGLLPDPLSIAALAVADPGASVACFRLAQEASS